MFYYQLYITSEASAHSSKAGKAACSSKISCILSVNTEKKKCSMLLICLNCCAWVKQHCVDQRDKQYQIIYFLLITSEPSSPLGVNTQQVRNFIFLNSINQSKNAPILVNSPVQAREKHVIVHYLYQLKKIHIFYIFNNV